MAIETDGIDISNFTSKHAKLEMYRKNIYTEMKECEKLAKEAKAGKNSLAGINYYNRVIYLSDIIKLVDILLLHN